MTRGELSAAEVEAAIKAYYKARYKEHGRPNVLPWSRLPERERRNQRRFMRAALEAAILISFPQNVRSPDGGKGKDGGQ